MDTFFCLASVTSGTYAEKAQRILSSFGIPCRVVKLDGEKSRRGCSYGTEFPCAELERARELLRGRVRVKHFYRGDTEI